MTSTSTSDGPITADEPLPVIRTALGDAQVRERLDALARRGRLPGYRAGGTGDAALFSISEFGAPFESVLEGRREGDVIRFHARLRPMMPVIFAAVLLLTVWPGVWMTESLLKTYLPGTLVTTYTWWWYLLLTVPFCPLAWRGAIAKSRASARAEATELIGRIAAAAGDGSGGTA